MNSSLFVTVKRLLHSISLELIDKMESSAKDGCDNF